MRGFQVGAPCAGAYVRPIGSLDAEIHTVVVEIRTFVSDFNLTVRWLWRTAGYGGAQRISFLGLI